MPMHAVRHALQSHAALIAWRSKYEQGVFIIDEQHRAIIAVINSLYYAMQNNHGIDMLHPVVGMIAEYTRIHFETEEEFHRKCDFPDAERHHSLHLELTRKMSKIARKSEDNKDPYQFMQFLKDWWNNHICKLFPCGCHGVDRFRDGCRPRGRFRRRDGALCVIQGNPRRDRGGNRGG